MARLTVLSYGAGQDSEALLQLYINDQGYRERYAPGRFMVIISDTGDEHPHTVAHIQRTALYCSMKGVEFYHVTPDLGFHARNWQTLRGQYRHTNTVGGKAFNKACTDQLKIQPFYRFLDQLLGMEYGYPWGRKKALLAFAEEHGKIDVILGLSKGEEDRVSTTESPNVWMRRSVKKVYPLIDLGMDRARCQEYIASVGRPVPFPSNCMLCPFMSEIELVWLFRFYPADYEEWVQFERNKMKKFSHLGEKNYGVWGKKTLPEVLLSALKKYGHMTDAQLHEYKMSHGHCTKSKY